MPLLALVTREAVDEDYVHAARRRAAAGAPQPPSHAHSAARGGGGDGAVRPAGRARRGADGAQRRRPGGQPRRPHRAGSASGSRRWPRCEERIAALRQENADLAVDAAPAVQGQLAEATVQLRTLQISTGFVGRQRPRAPDHRLRQPRRQRGRPGARHRPPAPGQRPVAGRRRGDRDQRPPAERALARSSTSNIAVAVNRSPLTPPYVVSAIGERHAGRPAAGQHLRRRSSRRWPTSSASWSTGRMRPRSLLPRRPDTQLRLR